MAYPGIVVHTATISSFSTSSSQIDLGAGYGNVYLVVPTMTSNSQVHIQVSEATGGTFRRLTHPPVNTATIQAPIDFGIASSVTDRIVPIPVGGFRFLKVECSAIVSFTAGFKVIGSN